MTDVQNNGLQYFVIIAEQKKKNKFLSLIGEYGAHGIQAVYAHGSPNISAFASAFGFEVEQNKVIISCLLKNDKAKELLNVLYNEYNFNKPNTGIAFSVSVEGFVF